MAADQNNLSIEPLLAKIPASILTTSKALGTYKKLETVLRDYAHSCATNKDSSSSSSSSSKDDANANLEKKLRPILTDAGLGRKGALEIVNACTTVSFQQDTNGSDDKADDTPEQPSNESPATIKDPTPTPATADTSTTTQSDLPTSTSESKTSRKSKRATKSASRSTKAHRDQKHHIGSSSASSSGSASEAEDELSSRLSSTLKLKLDRVLDPKIPLISALSQESRFFLDTTADTSTLEIDLKNVSLQLANQDLLSDAHLRLKSGVHYGLVGRNGSGKSTLLLSIAEKLIPGLPKKLKILFVSQLSTAQAAEQDPNLSVLDVVIKSDVERNRTVMECNLLTSVLDEQDQSQEQDQDQVKSESKIRDAVLQIHLLRAKERLTEAAKIATKWSGTKGSWARKDLILAEKEYRLALERVENPSSATISQVDETANQDQSASSADWSSQAANLLLEAQTQLESMDAAGTESRAQKVLHGLGFSSSQISGSYSLLSGGWRSRVSLASALLQPAHILLLDEPVNYLDLPAVLFVQSFIASIPHTVVTVSHDREFLDAVSDELVILRKQKLTYFDGNLTTYTKEFWKKRNWALRQQEILDKKKEKVQKSIQEAAKAAKKSNDDNKLKMVKSRQKKLDTRWGLEVNAKGHKFKLNRDMAGYFLSNRAEVEIEELDDRINFSFPDPEPLRFAGNLVHLDNVSVRYEGNNKDTISGINLTIGPHERVAIVGPNGHGKTTLLNAMVGNLTLSKGSVERHTKATFGIYAQHTLELLSGEPTTALAHFLAQYPQAGESQARSFLGQLGLKGRTADTVLLTGLSGGQLVRLGLAEVMWTAPDLVILDEVTTHLDSDTIEALVDALRIYSGAIVLVSHDRYAVKRIIELAKDDDATEDQDLQDDDQDDDNVDVDMKKAAKEPGRTYLLKNGAIRLLKGGMDEYTNQVVREIESQL